MENCANILLLGKTGVGKSSFINYFIGQPLAKVGDGRPVTQDYFTPYEIADGEYPIQIFDTKGLEAMNAHNQMGAIIEGVKERNNSDDVMNWFHTIFYCVSMANNRFEEFEANFIRQLREEISQHIHIILTQCDAVQPDVIDKMRTKIINDIGNMEGIKIFEVISITKKKATGEVVEPRGKEKISESVFELLVSDIASKISIDYASTLWDAWYSIISRACAEFDRFIDDKVKIGTLFDILRNDDAAFADLDIDIDEKLSKIEAEFEAIQNETDMRFLEILRPMGQLYASYYGIVTDFYVDHANLAFSDATSWMDTEWFDNLEDNLSIGVIFPQMERFLDKDGNYKGKSFWDILNTICAGVDDVFHLKSNLKKLVKQFKDKMMFECMPSEEELQEKAYEKIVDFLT